MQAYSSRVTTESSKVEEFILDVLNVFSQKLIDFGDHGQRPDENNM